ncbi:hypothetical protein MesoLjLb_72150 [Mesorhizobium sp. L-8-3]|nr:hypothetical protein MesoLjLb_72150 [Mesorhizobium sp. L-8-3]
MPGSGVGALFRYGLGHRLGTERTDALAERFGKFLRLETYHRLADAYRRNHFRASLAAQLVPTVRNYLPLAAGALRLPPSPSPACSASFCGMPVSFSPSMREAGRPMSASASWSSSWRSPSWSCCGSAPPAGFPWRGARG